MSKKMNICLDERFYCKMVDTLLMSEAFASCLIEDIKDGELKHVNEDITNKLLETFQAQIDSIKALHSYIIAANVMNMEMEKSKN